MSIRAAIKRHVKAGRLSGLEMSVPGDAAKRGLYLSPDVQELLDGPWISPRCAQRVNRLRADLEAFVKEEPVIACLDPFEAEDAFFGRLDRPDDEVWDVRSRDPKPGLRLFGRFACPDIFVAFTWAPRSVQWNGREPMGDRYDPRWEQMKEVCYREWDCQDFRVWAGG